LISSVETVSFSLTIGTAFASSRAEKALRALFSRSRLDRSACVSNTCAVIRPTAAKASS
jgi:hypothetical protein